jgi:hypothetical protein
MGIQIAGYIGVQTRFNKLHDGGGNIYYHPIYYRRVGKVDVSNNEVKCTGVNACIKVEPLGGGGKVVISGNITEGGERGIVMQSLNTDSYLDAVITNNIVKNTTEYGIIHSKDTGGSLAQNNVIVSNNVISGCFCGIAMFKVNQLLTQGNVIEGATSNPIYIQDCSLFRVSENTVRSAAVIDAGGYSGIRIGNGTTTFTGAVTDNMIRSDSTTGTRYGVECIEDTYSILDLYDNVYSGNYTSTTNVAGPFTTDISYTRTLLEINEPSIKPSVSGSPVIYSAKSTDSNVDLQLRPKGTGGLYADNTYGTHFRAGPGTATVANYISAIGGVSGASPTLTGTGTDGNVGIEIKGKSQGVIELSNGYGKHFRAGPGAATVVNYVQASGGVSGLPAVLSGTGTDTDVGLAFTTKGTGKFEFLLTKVPTFADDAAAGTGGLTSGQIYKTATGVLMIKL